MDRTARKLSRIVVTALTLLAPMARASAECAADAKDSTGKLIANLKKVPMDSKALDGWLLVPAGPTGCAPVAMNLHQPQQSIARAKQLAGTSAMDKTVIFYVNGVANTPEIECDVLHEISKATGKKVIGIYNGTDGLASDLIQTFDDRQRVIMSAIAGRSTDPAVRTLRALIVSEIFTGRPPEIWAHSQGAAIAALALTEAKLPLSVNHKDLSGLRVTTFASASADWPDGPRYEHYVHVGDLGPNFVGLGQSNAVPGKGAMMRMFGERGMRLFANHDVLKTYLPAWKNDHRKWGTW